MRKRIAVAIFLLVTCSMLSARSYYADCAGDDQSAASSPQHAWKSVEKISSTIFSSGDRILLKSGCTWKGSLDLHGSGTEGNPIIVDQYGEGPLPHVDGNGGSYALRLENGNYWEISHLELTNSAPDEGIRVGALVVANDTGSVMRHIYLKNLNVHDVRGKLGADLQAKRTGGIAFEIRGKDKPTRFDDILVEDCYVHDLDNTGIYTWTEAMTHPRHSRWNELQLTKVAVRKNKLRNIGKNAIVVRAAFEPVIENNVVEKAAQRTHGNAIFVFGSKDSRIQFNEVFETKYAGLEGAAYDSDFNSEGTIIQYNYSHDNGGGLAVFCSNPKAPAGNGYNDGTIVRYNVSRNEGQRVIGFDGTATNIEIYNNTIYLDKEFAPAIIDFDTFGKTPEYADHVNIRNNLIYNLGGGKYLKGKATNVSFEANCFFGKHPDSEPTDPKKITADPLLKDVSLNGKFGLSGLGLKAGSPCSASGAEIPNNGGRDYFGQTIPAGSPDRGAIQSAPETVSHPAQSEKFEFIPDLVYATPNGISLKADLYLPKGTGPFAGAVLLHGGGWSNGDRTQLHRPAEFLAAHGVVGMAIEYRLAPQAKYPAALDDSREAVRWLRKNASKYGIDPNRIFAVGSSAGGHLAAMLGTTSSREPDARVAAVVAFNPVLDLTTMSHRDKMVAGFLGKPCEEILDVCKAASPFFQVSSASVPFLILQGTADQTVPYQHSVSMVNALKAAGVQARLFTAEGAPHTFWVQTRWSEPTNEAMEQFLRQLGLIVSGK